MENKLQATPGQFDRVSFYVVAHADDWQLFMYPHVYDDLESPGCKVIFIITTAGDAGMGEKFWTAREEGSKSSVRFCLAPLSSLTEASGNRHFNGRPVHYCSINNTVSYFLRLPDGSLDGNGHGAGNFQSLYKFRSAQIEAITTIDNSATYPSWPELVTTLQSIIAFESANIVGCRINYPNPDKTANPNDHPDHIATGEAVQDMSFIKTFHQLLFAGYSSCNELGHLPPSGLFYKAGIFAAYEKAVYDCCGYSTLKENADLYMRWCCSKAVFQEKPAVH